VRLFLASQGLGALPEFLGGARDVLYVPTAAKPMSGQDGNRETLVAFGHRVVDLDIDGTDDLSALDAVDAIFVEGGSPFFLLQAMRESGFDSAVTDAVRSGLPYVGMSAGAVVAGPDLEPLSTTSNTALGPRLRSTEGLGLVDSVVFPHYNSRAAEYTEVEAQFGGRYDLVPLEDSQALIVDDDGSRIVPSDLASL
jgi:dipeptidase E